MQNKFLFFAIIGLAIVAVVGMFVVRQYFLTDQQPLELVVIGEPVAIQVVVAPSIKPWAQQAAQSFNQGGTNTRVELIEAQGLVPTGQFGSNPQVKPPAAWLAEASFVVELARAEGLSQFSDPQSVASTTLTWGAFNDKEAAFSQTYGPLAWPALEAKAADPANPLALVIASPHNSAQGLGVFISATAAHLNTTSLSAAGVRQADSWLTDTFKENVRVLPRPAEAFAASTGRSIGDAGLLSLAAWRSAGLQGRTDFSLTPAEPAVRLDYPLVIWTRASQAEQEAARQFRQFLLSEAQQSALVDFDRADPAPPAIQTDGEAVQALLRWSERVLK